MALDKSKPYSGQVAEIVALGGPAPQMGETKEQYTARVNAHFGIVPRTALIPTTSPTASVELVAAQRPGTGVANMAETGTKVPEGGLAGFAAGVIPAAATSLLTKVGLGAVIPAAGALYGLSQLIGVQYPWETGPGEGFISPFTRDIVRDEQGQWVSRETRPDLFNGGAAGMLPGVGLGAQVVKTWSAGGWPFAMTSDGKIHTVTKNGIRKSWRPYRSIVLGKKMSTSMAKRAVRKLQSIKKLANDIERLGGTRTVYRNK